MKSDQWIKVTQLFDKALELAPEQREDFLRGETAGDQSLLQGVLSLLHAHELSGDFMETPFQEDVVWKNRVAQCTGQMKPGPEPWCPKTLGPYKVLRKLGRGGMGNVFLAHSPECRKPFAVKTLKRNPSGEEADCLSRECRVLSTLDHPNIVRYLGAENLAGVGNCLFMEYVNGPGIIEYCDRERLSLRKRLQLFSDVCRGVAHLHRLGWLHCDLKPANILIKEVNGAPVPKIIDFGIASRPGQTERPMMGSPAYLSPEALLSVTEGGALDARSDIFSLGILLRQLLLGVEASQGQGYYPVRDNPYDAYLGLGRKGRKVLAWRLNSTEEELRTLFQGRLARIMEKSAAPERCRRYESVKSLAWAIEIYLGRDRSLLGIKWMKHQFAMPMESAAC